MGVVSLLVLLATAAATAVGGRAAAVATVRINVAADLGNQSIVDQVTLLTTRKAAVYSIRSIGGACMDKAHLAETKGVGVIYITNDMKCDNTVANKNRLVLIYDSSNDTFVTNAGVKFNSSDTAAFNAQLVDLVQRVAKDNKTLVNPVPSGVMVPIWAVICVGTIVGALMAGNCIFFNKIRGMKMKTHPEKKSSPSSSSEKSEGSKRGSSSRKQKGSSRSSKSTSTRSEKKKNSSKRGKTTSIECRSSKSLSTKKCGNERPTSVKVIPVGPPAKKEEPKDEVAIVMAKQGSASLPERSMDRVRQLPTVLSSTVHRPPVISAQPRPATMGPPIVPTVSVIGHPPTPFQLLDRATSPLPPASTSSIIDSSQTAYTTRSKTTVANTQPSATPPPTTVLYHQQQPLPSVTSTPVPVALPKPAVVTPVTQSPTPSPTVPSTVPSNVPSSSKPSTTAVAPIPLTLVAPTTTVSCTSPSPCVKTADSATTPTTVPKQHVPISPAYSLASTPRSPSPSARSPLSSSREKAPTSNRSQRK